MEEDEVASLSQSDYESGSDEEVEQADGDKKKRAGPSTRRLLLLVKRQFELLLKPAAKLANLPVDTINIRRWEYQPLDMSIYAKKQRVAAAASSDVTVAPATSVAADLTQIDDEMLMYPQLNPMAEQPASAEPAENGHAEAAAPSTVTGLTPLSDVYLMLDDYPTLLACFDYLHNKRLRHRNDVTSKPVSDDIIPPSTLLDLGRLLSFSLDVSRDGFLRFERIESRRQKLLDVLEQRRAEEQLRKHTERKRKEEQARAERERLQREQEAEMEAQQRIQEEARAAAAAKELAEKRAAYEASALAARTQKLAELEAERVAREADRLRQAQRRQEQREQEDRERLEQEKEAVKAKATATTDEDTVSLLRQRALDALRRKQTRAEEDAAEATVARAEELRLMESQMRIAEAAAAAAKAVRPDTPPPPVIDLAAEPNLTSSGKLVLEQWFLANLDKPFPNESQVQLLARRAEVTPAQVLKWFDHARKTEWASMPTLLSSSEEAALAIANESMAARVAAAGPPAITMKLKARPKLQTDETATATVGGFVRVEGAYDEIEETQLPQSHPSQMRLLSPMAAPVPAPSFPSASPVAALDSKIADRSADAGASSPPRSSSRRRSRSRSRSSRSRSGSSRSYSRSRSRSWSRSRSRDRTSPPSIMPTTDAHGRPLSAEEAAIIAAAMQTEQKRLQRKKEEERKKREERKRHKRSRSGSRDPKDSTSGPPMMPAGFFPPFGFPPGMPGYPPFAPFGMPGFMPPPVPPISRNGNKRSRREDDDLPEERTEAYYKQRRRGGDSHRDASMPINAAKKPRSDRFDRHDSAVGPASSMPMGMSPAVDPHVAAAAYHHYYAQMMQQHAPSLPPFPGMHPSQYEVQGAPDSTSSKGGRRGRKKHAAAEQEPMDRWRGGQEQ